MDSILRRISYDNDADYVETNPDAAKRDIQYLVGQVGALEHELYLRDAHIRAQRRLLGVVE